MQGLSLLHSDDAIRFPRSLSASDPSALFNLCGQIATKEGDVVLDASDLSFIDPLGLAVLRATLETQPDDRTFHVRWMQQELITYLVRMDFFQGLSVEGIDTASTKNQDEERFKCVELLKVIDSSQTEDIASRLAMAMIGQCVEDADSNLDLYRHPIEYALKELLENAVSHARREGNGAASVWVACQYFKVTDKVRLAIVDNGCGFLATLKDHAKLTEKSHKAAIQTALLERVSCNRGPLVAFETDSQNQGVGLTMTAKIADASDGHLVVASGDAWLHTRLNDGAILAEPGWKGVAVAFECAREKLPQIDIPSMLPEVEQIFDTDCMFE